jgi:hypothetical protein
MALCDAILGPVIFFKKKQLFRLLNLCRGQSDVFTETCFLINKHARLPLSLERLINWAKFSPNTRVPMIRLVCLLHNHFHNVMVKPWYLFLDSFCSLQ